MSERGRPRGAGPFPYPAPERSATNYAFQYSMDQGNHAKGGNPAGRVGHCDVGEVRPSSPGCGQAGTSPSQATSPRPRRSATRSHLPRRPIRNTDAVRRMGLPSQTRTCRTRGSAMHPPFLSGRTRVLGLLTARLRPQAPSAERLNSVIRVNANRCNRLSSPPGGAFPRIWDASDKPSRRGAL
jgi:hypothetical protein